MRFLIEIQRRAVPWPDVQFHQPIDGFDVAGRDDDGKQARTIRAMALQNALHLHMEDEIRGQGMPGHQQNANRAAVQRILDLSLPIAAAADPAVIP